MARIAMWRSRHAEVEVVRFINTQARIVVLIWLLAATW